MVTQPGVEITWGELHMGSRSIFADAGMGQVAEPTKRRVVMRIDFRRARLSVPRTPRMLLGTHSRRL